MDPMTMAIGGEKVLSGIMGKRSASKARRQAKEQQAAALAFQKNQQQQALQQINLSQMGAMDRITAQGESGMGDTLSRLAGAGFNPGTGMGLGALRASKMDTRNALSQMASQMAAQRAAVFAGGQTSYPMIQPQAQGGQGAGTANMLEGLMGLIGPGGAPGTGAGPSLTLPMGSASNYGAMTGRAPGAMGQWGNYGPSPQTYGTGSVPLPAGFTGAKFVK